ncbi:hypothetical protein GF391_02530 [Candidatus Uhrbacteria bacterium]|nr:hypothetical protein [Candidatus Uhrbacteria bacterium]
MALSASRLASASSPSSRLTSAWALASSAPSVPLAAALACSSSFLSSSILALAFLMALACASLRF